MTHAHIHRWLYFARTLPGCIKVQFAIVSAGLCGHATGASVYNCSFPSYSPAISGQRLTPSRDASPASVVFNSINLLSGVLVCHFEHCDLPVGSGCSSSDDGETPVGILICLIVSYTLYICWHLLIRVKAGQETRWSDSRH